MPKRSFRIALGVVFGTITLVAAIGIYMLMSAFDYAEAPHRGTGKDVEVEIVSGMSFPSVASKLHEKGVISKPSWFRLYAMWEGKTTDVKTGKYLIKDNLTPKEVLAIIIAGVKEVTVQVRLPEGLNMLEFFELLDKAKVADKGELEKLARSKEFLAKYAITTDTVDGQLFPDTYQFRLGEKPHVVLERMIERHRKVWNELMGKHGKSAAKLKEKLGWSDRDLLVMASIVEKEAVLDRERPTIAQVFMNRLLSPSFKPKKLQTDPTTRYGCLVPATKSGPCVAWIEECTKATPPKEPGCNALHSAQLQDADNPYNTYAHEGLPPGPISNPGRAAIEATLNPDGTDYFYFVAKAYQSKEHNFSKSVEQHEKFVREYVKSLP